ncbi:hypothetical protein MMC30_003863 [Trapelia coarctata]|nr:hypothetical protein [Trapelia coarctata]
MASWTDITAVTAYSPVLLKVAGYTTLTQNGLAGGLNTIGIVGTIISTTIADKLGRRACLMGGAFGLFAGSAIRARGCNNAVPLQPRLHGYLGRGRLPHPGGDLPLAHARPGQRFRHHRLGRRRRWTVFVNPIMFATLENQTYFLFAALNLIWIPIVYLFYSETKDRSLESVEGMFTTSSPFSWKMEEAYRNGVIVLGDRRKSIAGVAERSNSSVDERELGGHHDVV